jgi:hypothetical protein
VAAYIPGTKLKVACAVLKMLGADRAESIASTTAEEVRLRLRKREGEVGAIRSRLDARDVMAGHSSDVRHESGAALAATAPREVPRIQALADDGATAAGRHPSRADEVVAWQPSDQPHHLGSQGCEPVHSRPQAAFSASPTSSGW